MSLRKKIGGKAGAIALDATFSEKSRVINWDTKDSYDTMSSKIDGMAIIKIDVWDTFDQETKDLWVNQLTQLTSRYTQAPSDKVLILIREMIPGNWGQSGVTGADRDFLSKSRIF